LDFFYFFDPSEELDPAELDPSTSSTFGRPPREVEVFPLNFEPKLAGWL